MDGGRVLTHRRAAARDDAPLDDHEACLDAFERCKGKTMTYKYERPEWKKTPIRAQIDEALREVEQVRSVLLALRNKAAQLDEYHQLRMGYVKQRPTGELSDADRDKAWKPVMKMGEFARSHAAGELSQLDGWMKSLTESELALNVLRSPSITGGGSDFVVKRSIFLKEQGQAWTGIRAPAILFDLMGGPRK